jgi:hypothetical protein
MATAAQRAGYFDDMPRLAVDELNQEHVRQVYQKLKGFEGQGGWSVSAESVRAFVRQFPPKLREPLLKLLPTFDTFDRSTMVQALQAGIDALNKPPEKKGYIVGLSPDSGSNVRITLEHELRAPAKERNWIFAKTVRDVLSDAQVGDEIVFCDDNVTSGSQAICQFMAWLDVSKDEWTDEQRTEHGIEQTCLSSRDCDMLTKLRVSIVTAAGTPTAKTALQSKFESLGLAEFSGLQYQRELSRVSPELGAPESFLQDVGLHVLSWARHGKANPADLSSEEAASCKSDALGYSGARALACSPSNVPAGTLTALWCPGVFHGEPWIPLLIRRGYLKHLVLM